MKPIRRKDLVVVDPKDWYSKASTMDTGIIVGVVSRVINGYAMVEKKSLRGNRSTFKYVKLSKLERI